jgi:chitodextrinase
MRKILLSLSFFSLAIMCGSHNASGQNAQQKKQIIQRYNQATLNNLQQNFLKKQVEDRQNAVEIARQRGWEVTIKNLDGTIDELMRVSPDGFPIYYTIHNVAAAKSTRADHLNIGGSTGLNLDGQNMTAYVWDGGPLRLTHQEYDGPGGNNRVSINDGVTALNGNSFHSQHVTGTIMASGFVAAAKGMAPQANALTNDWANDLAEATSAASGGMLLSNHSYGYAARDQSGNPQLPAYYFGGYIEDSRDWDNLMHSAPYYLMVVAAGNDGNDNTANSSPLNGSSSFDKLTGHSTSKNNMVVANGQDANIATDGTLNSVVINNSSSEGPTDDLRIKPDITGNGTNVYSTYDNADDAYNSITGTSMASPNVTGSLLLLQQHANNINGGFMKAATLKGVALHTADDAGILGPDAVFGWGLMNAKKAAETITQNGNESLMSELTLSQGQSYTTNVDSDGTSPLLASISWTDPAGVANTGTVNLSTPVLVNDLDIRVTKNSSNFTPYKLTGVNSNTQGDNNVDPYERVDVAGATGTYTITVTHKGSLTGGSQDFSLVVTGLTGTPVVCNATVPTSLSSSNIGSATATLTWTAVPAATYDVRYRATGTSTWTTTAVSGASQSLTGLSVSTQYEAQVRSKCTSGNSAYSASNTFTTTEVQLNYCASNGNSVADEYIGRVQLGTINNATGATAGGYADYTSISTDLTAGDNASITITPTWTGTLYNEGYAVWIDYNKNGVFTDAGEQVFSNAASQTTPVNGAFTIPTSAALGNTTMRVSMKYDGIPTSCETFNYGEVEDYTVNIKANNADTEAPTAPSALAASNVAETTLTLNWTGSTDNVAVTGYYIYQGSANIGTVTGTIANITGLTASTNYAFSITAIDAAGNESSSSNVVNVTTVTPPDTQAPSVPSGLAASSITETTFTLSWTASSDNVGVTGYDVYQGATNLGAVTGTSANITGLTASTTYAFSVRAKDVAGNVSTASSDLSVTTATPPDTQAPSIPSGLAASSVAQTTFTLSWTASSDNVAVTGYDVYQGATNIGTVAGITTDITGLTASTAYTFSVRAKDAAGNTSAASSSINVTTAAAPSGCSGGISSFPYSEGFETSLGAWTQATSDDINWTRDASGTPSGSTGPSSATEGTYYMYIESSGNGTGYPTKTAILNSPCLNLTAQSQATFSFDYHMYGSSMGSLSFEASTDGTNWTSLWSLSGNQGNAWSSASVDLAAYVGGTVELRYVGVTSTSYRSDMAIDNIQITDGSTPSCNDVTLSLTFDNYPEETSWAITDGSGSIVASGGTYGSEADGSTKVETACLTDGCYTFTINDAYGDGICCTYGNGSYNLRDASNTLLASGGTFTSSQATGFCVGNATSSFSTFASRQVVEEFVPTSIVRLHPNPVSDFLFVNAPEDTKSISIYTTSGMRIDHVRINNKGADVSQLKPGIYLLMIETGKAAITNKFIKN